MGILLSGWTFAGVGLLIEVQWDDAGVTGLPGDYDYDDNQSYLWVPITVGFNATPRSFNQTIVITKL
jgi:hypothetical protein